MTKPRDYQPGYVHKATRRTFQRSFFLTPKEGVAEIFGYLLAHAAASTGVLIHSATQMSTHYHTSATDQEANFGKFQSTLNSLLARVLNVSLKRYDCFWDCGEPSVQKIERPIDHVRQASYVMANPVVAGLVPTAAEWPGFMITPEMIGTTLTFSRPDHPFFRTAAGRAMPETIDLQIEEPPDAVAIHGPGWFKEQVAKQLAEKEAEIQAERNGKFLGADAVIAADPFRQTATPDKETRECAIICGDTDLLKAALARRDDLLDQYRNAFEQFRKGNKNVRFPAGTYALRVHYGIEIEAPPDEEERTLAA